MKLCYLTVIALLAFAYIGALDASAYTVLLDIDTDNDPTTVNESTSESTATVRVILQPTEPDEWITEIYFALGGSCWDCDPITFGYGYYGTAWELWWEETVLEFSQLIGNTECVTSFLCGGNPGWHCQFTASSSEGFTLTEPVFIATFPAWVADEPHPACPLPPSDLMTFLGGGLIGNTILLADEDSIDSDASSLTGIKGLFR
jgi:hypothetical protein